jgi:hypothetical protein
MYMPLTGALESFVMNFRTCLQGLSSIILIWFILPYAGISQEEHSLLCVSALFSPVKGFFVAFFTAIDLPSVFDFELSETFCAPSGALMGGEFILE